MQTTKRYEVYGRDASLGLYEAADEESAILACARDAGYLDVEDLEAQSGPLDLRALEVPAEARDRREP